MDGIVGRRWNNDIMLGIELTVNQGINFELAVCGRVLSRVRGYQISPSLSSAWRVTGPATD
jgi:hypothetical protein